MSFSGVTRFLSREKSDFETNFILNIVSMYRHSNTEVLRKCLYDV